MAMPRLLALTIINLFNHTKTVLDLSTGTAFLLVGDEGEGKSAVIKAIDLALNGRCQLDRVDGAALTADELWDIVARRDRPAGEACSVTLDLRGADGRLGALTRTRRGVSLRLADGATITTKEGIAQFFGVRDVGALAVAFRSQHIMSMKPAERVRLLFDALGKPITLEELRAEKIDDEEVQKGVLAGGVTRGRNIAEKKRQDAGREIRALKAVSAPGEPVFESPKGPIKVSTVKRERVERDIAKFEEDLRGILKAIGVAESAARGATSGALAAEAKKDLEKARKENEKRVAGLAALLESEEGKAGAALADERKELLAEIGPAKKEVEALEVSMRASTQNLDRLEKRLKELAKVEGPDMQCPFCLSSCRCETVVKRVQAELDAEEAKSKQLATQHGTATAKRDKIQTKGSAVTKKLDAWNAKLEAVKAEVLKSETALRAAEAYEVKVREQAEAAKNAPSTGDVAKLTEDRTTLEGRLRIARQLLTAIDTYAGAMAAWSKGQEAAKTLQVTVDRYAVMEKALGDDGFLAQKIKEPLALIREKVATVSTALFRVPHKIEVGDDMTFLLNGAPAEAGSRGEQATVGVTLAMAFSGLTGLGLVAIDDMNLLGAMAQDKVMDFILTAAKAGGLEQVIVAVTRQGRGWCDSCGAMVVQGRRGTCIIQKNGKPCGTRVIPSRPRGPLVGVLRPFEVTAGTLTEVLPLGAKS